MNPTPHPIPPVALGQIGMVTAPGAGGHVGIGIGIPIMTAGQLLQQPVPAQHHHHYNHNGLVSPDSSEDGLLQRRTQSPILPPSCPQGGGISLPWPSGPFLAGMGYPIMGMGPGSLLGEPNMYYGINLVGNHPQQPPLVNLPTHELEMIPHPNSIPVTVPQQPSSGEDLKNPMKEIIHCKSCTLFPPNHSAPMPTTREKPQGCRTVFVGGLPENVTDDIVREVFERCGEITTIRMSKKNFCHIRFESESYVDSAIYFSGYKIRIGSNSDNANIGRFHVDYAQARDDFFEWECRQRQQQREQRHRDRLEQERIIPRSPPPVVHYSEHEATTLAENIKVDENFVKSVQTLITWLERGDCTKRNATTFYSIVQSTHSHVKRLLNEKSQFEEEFQKAKALANQRMQGLAMQFLQVEKVFAAASHKKAWDHFTKAQRKNIEAWKKQAREYQTAEKLAGDSFDQKDDEMDLSDSDADSEFQPKKMRLNSESQKSIHQLKEENDSLRCQLEAFKNEVDLIKIDLETELEAKEDQLKLLHQLLDVSSGASKQIAQVSPTQSDTEPVTSQSLGISVVANNPPHTLGLETNCDSSTTQNDKRVEDTETEAKLIAATSMFLHVHPFGANLDCISSFAEKVVPTITATQIQSVLAKYPSIFKEKDNHSDSEAEASFERNWTFIGF